MLRHGERTPLFCGNKAGPGALGPAIEPFITPCRSVEAAEARETEFWRAAAAPPPGAALLDRFPVRTTDGGTPPRAVDAPRAGEGQDVFGQLTARGASMMAERGGTLARGPLCDWLSEGPMATAATSSNYVRTRRSVQELMAGLELALPDGRALAPRAGGRGGCVPVSCPPVLECPLAVFESGLPLAEHSRRVLRSLRSWDDEPEVADARRRLIVGVPYFQPDGAKAGRPAAPGQGAAGAADGGESSFTAPGEGETAASGHRGREPAGRAGDASARGSLASLPTRFLWIRAADYLTAPVPGRPADLDALGAPVLEHLRRRFNAMYDDPQCRRHAVGAPITALLAALLGGGPAAPRAPGPGGRALSFLSGHDVTLMPLARYLSPPRSRDAAPWPTFGALLVACRSPEPAPLGPAASASRADEAEELLAAWAARAADAGDPAAARAWLAGAGRSADLAAVAAGLDPDSPEAEASAVAGVERAVAEGAGADSDGFVGWRLDLQEGAGVGDGAAHTVEVGGGMALSELRLLAAAAASGSDSMVRAADDVVWR